MWKNPVESDRPQMKIWRICILCWITKATKKTHSEESECVIFTSVTLQHWLHERALLLYYTYIACLVLITCNWTTISYPIFRSFQNLRCRVSSVKLTLSQTDMKLHGLYKTLPKYTIVMFQVRQYDVKLGLNTTGGLNKRLRRMPGTVGGKKK